MGEVTRRKFLSQTSVGLGVAVTGLGVVAGLEDGVEAVRQSRPAGQRRPQGALPTPIVLHVKDAARGQLIVHAGTTQFAFHDPILVEHLLDAVGKAAAGGRGL